MKIYKSRSIKCVWEGNFKYMESSFHFKGEKLLLTCLKIFSALEFWIRIANKYPDISDILGIRLESLNPCTRMCTLSTFNPNRWWGGAFQKQNGWSKTKLAQNRLVTPILQYIHSTMHSCTFYEINA